MKHKQLQNILGKKFSVYDVYVCQLIIKVLRTHNPDPIKLHLIVKKLKFPCPPNSTVGICVIRKHSSSRPHLWKNKGK